MTPGVKRLEHTWTIEIGLKKDASAVDHHGDVILDVNHVTLVAPVYAVLKPQEQRGPSRFGSFFLRLFPLKSSHTCGCASSG